MSKSSKKRGRQREKGPPRAYRSLVRRARDPDFVVAGAWASSELDIRVSGRIDVVLAVRLGAAESMWTYTRSSMLAGGYLGSVSAPSAGSGTAPPFEAMRGGSLEPVGTAAAAKLVWGAFAWSVLRGGLDDGELPALGVLAPPIGTFDDWAEPIEARFSAAQLALADAVAEVRGANNSFHDRELAASGVAILEMEDPGAFAAALGSDPELRYDHARRAFGWRADPRAEALVTIDGAHARVDGSSPRAAARLVRRLGELGALRLRRAAWEPLEPLAPAREIVRAEERLR